MSPFIRLPLLSLLLTLIFTGCSEKAPEPEPIDIRCRIDGALAPEWACSSDQSEERLTAVGSAPFSKLGLNFSKHEAMSNARSNLAQQIQTDMGEKVKVFSLSNGLGDEQVASEISREVAKQAAKSALKESEQLKFWQNKNTKDVYVLVGVTKETLNGKVKKAVRNSYKENAALWRQFQSKGVSKRLDTAFPTE